MEIVHIENLVKVYEDKKRVPVQALNGVSLVIEQGEFTAIAGPSGSGKTTLLNLIGGLDKPTSGKILLGGQDIGELDSNALADFRLHNLGFVFQAYNLIPVLTALENVEFIMLLQGVPEKERLERAKQELRNLDIEENMMQRRPAELSGGQQQRVAVSRATVARPKLILADEPTANLDSKTGGLLLDKMREMNEKKGITFLFSTHDQNVMQRARRVVYLRDGEVLRDEAKVK